MLVEIDVPTGTKGETKDLWQPIRKPNKGSLIVYTTKTSKVAIPIPAKYLVVKIIKN